MKKFTLLIVVGGLILQGCVSTLKLDPQAQKGQKEIYNEGVETIISKKKALVAVRSATNTYSSENRPTVVIDVQNRTSNPFNFSTENVKVFVDGSPHKVFTYDELVDETNTKQAWAAAAAAIGGASRSYSAASAGTTYTSGSYNSYASTNYGTSAYGSGSYSGSTYNPAAAQQAQDAANAQTEAEMQSIKNRTEQSLNALSSTMLKKTTIQPRSQYGGYVTIEDIPNTDQPHEIKVIVTAAGEKHKFLFRHFKVQK